jgi:hypothetical protein
MKEFFLSARAAGLANLQSPRLRHGQGAILLGSNSITVLSSQLPRLFTAHCSRCSTLPEPSQGRSSENVTIPRNTYTYNIKLSCQLALAGTSVFQDLHSL